MSRLNGKNYCNSWALCPCRIKFCHMLYLLYWFGVPLHVYFSILFSYVS